MTKNVIKPYLAVASKAKKLKSVDICHIVCFVDPLDSLDWNISIQMGF